MSCPSDIASKAYVDSKFDEIRGLLSQYIRRQELNSILAQYALKSELHDPPDLSRYALRSEIPPQQDLSNLLRKDEFTPRWNTLAGGAGLLGLVGIVDTNTRNISSNIGNIVGNRNNITRTSGQVQRVYSQVQTQGQRIFNVIDETGRLRQVTAEQASAINETRRKANSGFSKATTSIRQSNIAQRTANTANRFANSALGKATANALKIINIIGSIAGILSLVGLFMSVFPRLDAHDREIASNRNGINEAFSAISLNRVKILQNTRVNQHQENTLNLINSTIANLNFKTNRALQRGEFNARDIASIANGQRQLRGMINQLPPQIRDDILRQINPQLQSLNHLINSYQRQNNIEHGNIWSRIFNLAGTLATVYTGYQLLRGLPSIVSGLRGIVNNLGNRINNMRITNITNNTYITNNNADPTLKPLILEGNKTSLANQRLLSGLAFTLGQLNTFINAQWTWYTDWIIDKFQKLANSRVFDKAISLLNLALNIHSNVMLSQDLGESFLYMFSNILASIGIKDDEGNPFDFASIIGNSIEDILRNVLGDAVYNNASKTFNSLNRIYQAGINVISSISQIIDSSRTITETIGEYVGKIGNALRNSRAVAENAYKPMQEKWDKLTEATNSKWSNFWDKVEDIEDKVSVVDTVASEVLSIQETVNELKNNREEFRQSIRDYETTQTNIVESEDHIVNKSLEDLEIDAKLNSDAPVTLESARF